MEIRIGIAQSAREISFESNESASEITSAVTGALAKDGGVLSLVDNKGKVYLVPTAALAYVEIGSEEARRVGFVA